MTLQVYLQRLIGKIITNTAITTSTVVARKASKDDPDDIKAELTFQLYFEEYLLNIYNPMTILPLGRELTDLEGLELVETNESREVAELTFANGYRLIIDMRDEAYDGPEALYLTGPDFWVAW